MRILILITLISNLALAASASAMGRKQPAPPYSYDPATLSCVNAERQPGRNPGFLGQCGSQDDQVLDTSRLRRQLAKPGVDLSGASFRRSTWTGITLNSAQLRYVDFTDAKLAASRFVNTRLNGSDFSGADLSGVEHPGTEWTGGIFDERTRLPFNKSVAIDLGMVFRKTTHHEDDGKTSVLLQGVTVRDLKCDLLSGEGSLTYRIDDGMGRMTADGTLDSGRDFDVRIAEGACPMMLLLDFTLVMTSYKVSLVIYDGALVGLDRL